MLSDYLIAVLLGVIQGITEFLPISSSGHLIIFSHFTQGQAIPLSLNLALHLGTLLATLIYFYRDWCDILAGIWRWATRQRESQGESRKLLLAILIGTIPASIVGLLFKREIEEYLHHPLATILPLIVVGIALYLVDKMSKSHLSLQDIGPKQGFLIGLAQSLALMPGTSRSGITIIAARALGIERGDAARFSFLLGAPVMAGAIVIDYKNIVAGMVEPIFYIGVLVSFLVGYLTIAVLLQILRRFGFAAFAIYRVCLGIALYLLMT